MCIRDRDSYYVGGGSILGHRDSWQDMLAILPNDPDWARERVIYMLEHQFPDGSTLHNWDPLTNIGVKTGHSDDPMWLVLGVIAVSYTHLDVYKRQEWRLGSDDTR